MLTLVLEARVTNGKKINDPFLLSFALYVSSYGRNSVLLHRGRQVLFNVPWPINIFLIHKLRARLFSVTHAAGWSITGQGLCAVWGSSNSSQNAVLVLSLLSDPCTEHIKGQGHWSNLFPAVSWKEPELYHKLCTTVFVIFPTLICISEFHPAMIYVHRTVNHYSLRSSWVMLARDKRWLKRLLQF